MPFLTSQDDSVVKKNFEIKEVTTTIGRHPDCDVVIEDVSVSRKHARISQTNGDFFVEDLTSRNGTLVNNQEIREKTRISEGTQIQICEVLFTFQLTEETPQTPSQKAITAQEKKIFASKKKKIFVDDNLDNSMIMSQLELPSHHAGIVGKVSPQEKLTALMQITHALTKVVKRDSIVESAIECLFELFVEADRGFIAFRTEDSGIELASIKTRSDSHDEQIRISRTVFNQVVETRKAILSSDAAEDDRFDLSQSIVDFRIRSMMCAPILNDEQEAIGIIQLDTLRQTVAFQEEDLEILATVAAQVGLALQRLEYFAEVQKAEQVKNDLELAYEVQQRFLPQESPKNERYDFYAFYRAAEQVGGDYYDYIQLDEHNVAVIVADVVGHGIAAALLMAKLSGEARFALATHRDPAAAFHQINNALSDLNLDKFVTAIMGLFNTQTNEVTFVNAGHMEPLLRRSSGEVAPMTVEGRGMPLGVLDDTEYGSSTFALEPGDVILMYTDGVNECMNSEEEQLGTNALINEIMISQAKTAQAIGQTVYNTVERFAGSAPQHDDICFVCVGRNRKRQEQPTEERK